MLWLQLGSDACIGVIYFFIPLALAYLIRKRYSAPLPFIFWLFSLFVLLRGTAHFMNILMLWLPDHDVEGWVKAASAAVAVPVLAALVGRAPRAIELIIAAQEATQNARVSEMVRKSEARNQVVLSAIVDNISDGILTIGEQGQIKSFNAACSRLYGYAPEEVLGQDVEMLLPESFKADRASYRQSYLESGKNRIVGTGSREVGGRRKDGTIFPVEITVSSFTLDDERFFIGCVRDITQQKAALEERDALLARLTQSNAELERFAYVASHDMQEPVRMMLSFSQLLEQDYAGVLDRDGRDYLKIIASSATRMRDMIRDLMDYARLDGERQNFTEIDLCEELAAVEENLRQLIHESNAVITSQNLPRVHGSAVQIMRLLQNLIINAIKYQPPGKTPWIHFGVTELSGERLFYLRDNGLGIKPEFIETIFEPFRRLHTWDSIPGTGLGLSVCRKIVEGHGGRIWAESKPGNGTTIYFTLA